MLRHKRFETATDAAMYAAKIAHKYPMYFFASMLDWRDKKIWRVGIFCKVTSMYLGYVASTQPQE